DVVEADRAKRGCERPDGLDDLKGIQLVEANREGVDTGEGLEEHALALGDRQCGFERASGLAEEVRAIGDDGDGVAAGGEVKGALGAGYDFKTGVDYPRRIYQAKCRAVTDGNLAPYSNKTVKTSATAKSFVAIFVDVQGSPAIVIPLGWRPSL